MIEIKNRYTNAAIYRSDTATTVREAVEEAVNAGANLGSANLTNANLADADLSYAYLVGAYLVGAILTNADLSYAYLGGANLGSANLGGFNAPSIPDIDAAILAAIENGGTLEMGEWHTCETTHCRAGWAIHLAGDAGRALETRIGPSAAGALIYAASGSHPVPYWHAANAKAMADLRERAARSNAAIEGAQ